MRPVEAWSEISCQLFEFADKVRYKANDGWPDDPPSNNVGKPLERYCERARHLDDRGHRWQPSGTLQQTMVLAKPLLGPMCESTLQRNQASAEP